MYSKVDPSGSRPELKERTKTFMDIYHQVHQGFVALGLSRILPTWLRFLVRSRADRLTKLGAMTVRDVLYAVVNLNYTANESALLSAVQKAEISSLYTSRRFIKRSKQLKTKDAGPATMKMSAHRITKSILAL